MKTLQNNQLRDCYHLEKGLTVFHGIRKDEIFKAFNHLLKILFREPRSTDKIEGAYHHLCALLLKRSLLYQGPGDLWQDYLLDFILKDENSATLFLEKYPLEEMGGSLQKAFEGDLYILQALFQIRGTMIKEIVQKLLAMPTIPCWEEANPLPTRFIGPEVLEIRGLFFQAKDWRLLLPQFSSFLKEKGVGIFGHYYALRWQDRELKGISRPDPISFRDLFGYGEQIESLMENTEKLVQGLPSSNVLLYGDRGTGKSSAVKALLQEYGSRGLRLIEVRGEDVAQLSRLYYLLGERGLSFILFIDDLSFHDEDPSFREMKAILEGRVEILPENVRIYATSNLRHLVQEKFRERDNGDEVHPGDLFQEKISLADRFGLHLIFTRPDQSAYLKMVTGMANRAGISMDEDDLKKKALAWTRRTFTPNGRTARQFIDYLTGEVGLGRGLLKAP